VLFRRELRATGCCRQAGEIVTDRIAPST